MLYCPSCASVFENEEAVNPKCPICHSHRLREAREEDICLFAEYDAVMATVVTDLLTQENLPFLTRPIYGAGISAITGQTLDSIRFYTRYPYYALAVDFMEHMFPVEAEKSKASSEETEDETEEGTED